MATLKARMEAPVRAAVAAPMRRAELRFEESWVVEAREFVAVSVSESEGSWEEFWAVWF